MRRRSLFPAVAFVAVGLLACESPTSTSAVAAPSFAKANTTKSNIWLVVEPTEVTDPCTGEAIILSGKIHLVQTTTDPGDGTSTATAHVNYAGISGYGVTNGLKYNLVATQKQSEMVSLVGYANRTQQQVGLVSQGSTDNYLGRLVTEWGFDGTDYYDVELRFSEKCTG